MSIELPKSSAKGRHARAKSEIPEVLKLTDGHGMHALTWAAQYPMNFSKYDHSTLSSPTNVESGVSENERSTDEENLSMSDDESSKSAHNPVDCDQVIISGHSTSEAASCNLDYLTNDARGDLGGKTPTLDDGFSTDDEVFKESGIGFESLVDRLLSAPVSKSDAKFAAIFLCLYRKFAAPSELLLGIIHRFEELSETHVPSSTSLAAQLRYLNILREWVSNYPGDFAHPLTRRMITNFVQRLATSPAFSIAYREICPHLDIVVDDDDTEWSCPNKTRSRASTIESFLTMSSVQSAVSTLTADSSTEDIIDLVGSGKEESHRSTRISATPSSNSSISRSISPSTLSLPTMVNSVENAQRQARSLTPKPRNILDKPRWHFFMEVPEDQLAQELTRIDWVLYSSIRPRDLVRHVSLRTEQKEKCKSLEHVNRMINQFNHVACWVANMILLREKAKHRARALEKFMAVAWKLRYLNNYNALGAVIAGINGTAVHRLAQTRDLISPEARKQFMRLEILMGTQKSHFAYRLAWSNTSTPRIPFLPLHRRDLVFAEEGNRTFITYGEKDRINWKKFEIMGEVIIGVQKSQEIAYPTIKRNEEIQRLILEGKFTRDDDVSTLRFLKPMAKPRNYHCEPYNTRGPSEPIFTSYRRLPTNYCL